MNKGILIAIPLIIILSIVAIGFGYYSESGTDNEISESEDLPELEVSEGKNLTIRLTENIGIAGT